MLPGIGVALRRVLGGDEHGPLGVCRECVRDAAEQSAADEAPAALAADNQSGVNLLGDLIDRLRHTLSEQRGEWQQRIQATLYHHGCPQRRQLMTGDGREWLAAQPLPAAAREQVTVALEMIDALERQMAPLEKELRAYARRQVGCKALMAHYGIGELTAVTILAELGDCTRFSSSRLAVRYAGMDITVHQSDQRRAPGHLSRQGPPALRWALFEAAQSACRQGSPDREYYTQAAERLGHNRACLSLARKLLKRSYHTLRELGEEARRRAADATGPQIQVAR